MLLLKDEARDEIRVALMLNGGVSLAVWMGGVAHEINRMTRASDEPPRPQHDVYRRLLQLTESGARVDVMAGASAGGMNGALLALAVARRRDFGSIRDIWVEHGSFQELFRSPLDKDAPSLLKGDGYLLQHLRNGLREIAGPERDAECLSDDLGPPIHLIMTTTLFDPIYRDFDDDYDSVIRDESHRGEFHFVRLPYYRGRQNVDDFRDPQIVDKLALAARTTASFPIAFEPSFIPIGTSKGVTHPKMGTHVNFQRSGYAMDGGVLVNTPIHPLLRAIFAQPTADERVRRILAYVVPDPGLPFPEPRDDAPPMPTLFEVGTSILSLPRVESVAEDLQTIRDHNRRVRAQREIRRRLIGEVLSTAAKAMDTALSLFPVYRGLRKEEWLDNVVSTLENVVPAAPPIEASQRRRAWRAALSAAFDAKHPAPEPLGERLVAMEEFLRGWDGVAIEQMAMTLLNLIRERFRLPCAGAILEELASARREIHEALGVLRLARFRASAAWRDRLPQLGPTLADWASDAVADDANDRAAFVEAGARLGGVAHALPEVIRRAQDGTLNDVSTSPPGDTTGSMSKMAQIQEDVLADARQVEQVVPPLQGPVAPAARGEDEDLRERTTLTGHLATAMVELTLAAPSNPVEQPVELIQVSAFTKNAFDGRATPEEKVAGVQLGHFGGFYKSSWRANDWMWGRLDGAYRLVQVLLRPEPLRESYLRRYPTDEAGGALFAAVREIVVTDPELSARELLDLGWDDQRIQEELKGVFAGNEPPRELPQTVQAVARRIQTEILRSELVSVADAVHKDKALKANEADAERFAALVDEARGDTREVPAAEVPRLFEACRIGEELILDEGGTDLFTSTATTLAAVTGGALQSDRSGLGPVKPLMRSIRGFLLAIWGAGRAATTESQTARAVFALTLMIGGAILAVALLSDDVPGLVVVIGAAAVAVGVIVMVLAVWSWKALPIVLGVLGLTLVIAFAPRLLEEAGVGEGSNWIVDVRWIFPIVALVVGTYVLGIAGRGWVANAVAILGLIGVAGVLVWGIGTVEGVWLLRVAIFLLGLALGIGVAGLVAKVGTKD